MVGKYVFLASILHECKIVSYIYMPFFFFYLRKKKGRKNRVPRSFYVGSLIVGYRNKVVVLLLVNIS